MEEEYENLLFEDEIAEFQAPQLKHCEWCSGPLPNERYHLKICPKCRKSTIDAFMKGQL